MNEIDLKLFIGQLPKQWDEMRVKQFFEQYGPILDLQMIAKKFDSKLYDKQIFFLASQKGSAFVRFKSMIDAENCINDLKDKPIDGQGPLVIKWADGEKEKLGINEESLPRLYVSNLPKDCDETLAHFEFSKYGKIQSLEMLKNANAPAAAILYQYKASCVLAMRTVNGKMVLTGFDNKQYTSKAPIEVKLFGVPNQNNQRIKIEAAAPIIPPQDMELEPTDLITEYRKSYTRWLDNKKKPYYVHWETGEVRKQVPPLGSIIYSPDGTKETITKEKYLNDLAAFNSKKTGPPGSNLFVFHLPNDHKDSDLMELFSPYGNVISARVMTEPKTGKSKGFGFVSFDRPESAIKAKEAMDGFLIEKKKLSVTFKQNDGSMYPLQYQWIPTIKLISFDAFDI